MNLDNKHKDYFFCISKRSMSLISAGLLLTFFSIFMTGYVWGKRIALEDILRAVEQKTFADQISGSLYALSCSSACAKKECTTESEPVEVRVIEDQVDEPVSLSVPLIHEAQESTGVSSANNIEKQDGGYYAQLVGFGSKKTAQQFANRLKNDSPTVECIIKERSSITSRGKKRVWYQVVTPLYTNKEDLERFVDYITKKEHLSGVRIVAC